MSPDATEPEVLGPDLSLMRPQVTDEARKWADNYTSPPSDAVAAIREETKTAAPIPQMITGVPEARLIEAFAQAIHAQKILEVGTFTGATTLSLAERVPPQVRITTIEFDEAMAEVARRHFDASPFGDRIDLIVGDARTVVPDLEGPFDIIFIDAWKVHYVDYFEALLPKLDRSGIMLADDVIWNGMPFNDDAGDPESEGIRRFVEHVQNDSRVRNVILSVGMGLMLIWHDRSPQAK